MPADFNLTQLLVVVALRIGGAFVTMLVGRWLAGRARAALPRLLAKATLPPSIYDLSLRVTYYGILAVAGLFALTVLGVPVEWLLASVAAIILVLGVALQNSISNFAAFVIFMTFRPFKVGDFVETCTQSGTVTEMQLFNTVITNYENKVIVLPNSKIQAEGLVNFTQLGKLRLDLKIGVNYASDMARVRQILTEEYDADPRVDHATPLQILVTALGDSGVTVSARAMTTVAEYWNLANDMRERIKQRFVQEGIRFAFQQIDLHAAPPAGT